MGKKRKKRDHRPSRRAKRIVEAARLDARVILAEARADAALARSLSLHQTQAEIDRLRAEATADARHVVELARTEADWVLGRARELVDAEARAVSAEAELAAERLHAAANAAAEQLRRDAITAREDARRDLDAERARWRDEALLEAAKVREHAREEAATLLARITDEHHAVIAAVHHDAQRLAADAAAEARTDRAIEALLHSEAAAPAPPDPAFATAADPTPAAPPSAQPDLDAVPTAWTVEALADQDEPDGLLSSGGPVAEFCDPRIDQWSTRDPEERRHKRRWWKVADRR